MTQMPRHAALGAIAGLVASSVIGLPAIAAPADRFQTPSGNIHCMVYPDTNNQNTLRCDVLDNKARIPPQPADCPLDWGNVFSMGSRQPGGFGCAGDTIFDPSYPVLRYGQSWSFGGFRCDVTTSRLRCRNAAGHSWDLSRERQRFY